MQLQPSAIKTAWDRLEGVPGGRRLFDRMIASFIPYTGSIAPRVVRLGRGQAEVELRDRRRVRNHLQSIHAIALANLAEYTGNLALVYAMPPQARFIVRGLSIDYTKKARGTIRGICEPPIPETNQRQEYEVEVRLLDSAGDQVAHATLRTLVGPVPGAT